MSNYLRLLATSMRTISGQWLRDPASRAILEKYPKSAVILPDIEESHAALCDALGGDDPSPLEDQLAKLREEGGTLDARHDRKYRGSLGLFNALLELADKPETVARLTALRDALHPNGLLQVNAQWSAEAGNAETVHTSLDKTTRAFLKEVTTVEGRTLDDEVLSWVKAGEALGPIAARKATVEHQIANDTEVSSATALSLARNAWIKTARALETNLECTKALTAEERSTVLGLLHQTADAAERRSAARRQSDENTPQPVPAPPVTG